MAFGSAERARPSAGLRPFPAQLDARGLSWQLPEPDPPHRALPLHEGTKHLDGPERRIGGGESLPVEMGRARRQEPRFLPEFVVQVQVLGAGPVILLEPIRPRHQGGPGEHDVPLVHPRNRVAQGRKVPPRKGKKQGESQHTHRAQEGSSDEGAGADRKEEWNQKRHRPRNAAKPSRTAACDSPSVPDTQADHRSRTKMTPPTTPETTAGLD